MFKFVVESEPVVIKAPVPVVWDVLCNDKDYSLWNPFTPQLKTDFQVGSPVKMRVILGPLRLNLTEWVRDIQPKRLIAWGSDFGSRSLLTALKHQHIKEIDDGSCMYYTTDIMSGWLVPIVELLFAKAIRRGFENTGLSLKKRAETIHAETQRSI